jgi:hypothetical protein
MPDRRKGAVSGRWVVVAMLVVIGVAVLAAAWILFGPDSTFQKQHRN